MIKFLCIAFVFLTFEAMSARADIYDVNDIPISAEEASAQEARTVAIRNGQTVAFQRLTEKMVDEDDRRQMMIPTETEITDLVQKVSLSSEKYTATKYMANLSVRFNPEKVQALLWAQHVPFLTAEMPLTLVLPVWQNGEMETVLEEGNPLYAYLKDELTSVPDTVLIPAGDLEDMALARSVVTERDETAGEVLMDKYGAGRIWIIRMDPQFNRTTTNLTPDEILTDPTRGVISQIPFVWEKAVRQLEREWYAAHMNDLNLPDSFWVQVPITRLSDWVGIRQRLSQAPFIDAVQVYGFRPNKVFIALQYKGSIGSLQDKLEEIGFRLTAGDFQQVWVLMPKEANHETDPE